MSGKIHRLKTVDSTNQEAKRLLAQGATSGTTIVADEQTQGRGRSGRQWFSPSDDNLYLSWIHHTQLDPTQVAGLTLAAAVAVAQSLVRYGFDPELKWPNDILLNGRKVGGILCELELTPQRAVIVGIGLNINGQDFPADLAHTATSLLLAGHEPVDTESVITSLTSQLAQCFARYEQTGTPDMAAYRQYFRMAGRSVSTATGAAGQVVDVTEDGGLTISVDGVEQTVHSGEVTFL